MPVKGPDLSDRVFGGLLVIKEAQTVVYKDTKARMWKCLCKYCGKYTEVSTSNLNSGNSLSCGCTRAKPKGECAKNRVINQYRHNAKKRGLDFCLSVDECETFFQGRCYYCNSPPSNYINPERANGGYTYSGIDRLDSSKGYQKDNCVSCCKICNLFKGKLIYHDFLSKVADIYNYKIGGEVCQKSV